MWKGLDNSWIFASVGKVSPIGAVGTECPEICSGLGVMGSRELAHSPKLPRDGSAVSVDFFVETGHHVAHAGLKPAM